VRGKELERKELAQQKASQKLQNKAKLKDEAS